MPSRFAAANREGMCAVRGMKQAFYLVIDQPSAVWRCISWWHHLDGHSAALHWTRGSMATWTGGLAWLTESVRSVWQDGAKFLERSEGSSKIVANRVSAKQKMISERGSGKSFTNYFFFSLLSCLNSFCIHDIRHLFESWKSVQWKVAKFTIPVIFSFYCQ